MQNARSQSQQTPAVKKPLVIIHSYLIISDVLAKGVLLQPGLI